MAKQSNESESVILRVTLSRQSHNVLEKLARQGIFGRNAAEVAARFVDQALQSFVDIEKTKVSLTEDGK